MRGIASVTALTALLLLPALTAGPETGHAQSTPQSWEQARYPGEIVDALLIGNRAVLDIAPHREPVLTVHRDGTLGWTEQGGNVATGTWSVAADGRFCADWENGPSEVLALEAASSGAWCFYLRRTESALLLYDPFGNVRGGIVRIDLGSNG